MHASRGFPLISIEQEPHLPALQFHRQARSGACVACSRCSTSRTTSPSLTSIWYSCSAPPDASPRQIRNFLIGVSLLVAQAIRGVSASLPRRLLAAPVATGRRGPGRRGRGARGVGVVGQLLGGVVLRQLLGVEQVRSEERRVGKEGSARWAPGTAKKKRER